LDRPLSTRAKSGRPKVTTQKQDNAIVEMTREMPFTNTTQIKEELQLNCSANTIAGRLHASELHARTPAKKIELTETSFLSRKSRKGLVPGDFHR
jgi:Mn-dependent DtxR family transcriptional regulator